jgi:hypothetical protein
MQPQATLLTGAIGHRAPSPDFSSLSPDELERLEVVLQKQALVENEQNQRLSGLRRTMLHLQQTIETDHQRQRTFSSTSSYNTSPIQQNQTFLSSSNLIQCYICYSNIEIPSNNAPVSPPILCADCHRPVCRRCGNYTSPELIHIQYGNTYENQTHTSKWRCRMCIVRREVVRKSGMYFFFENEIKLSLLNN